MSWCREGRIGFDVPEHGRVWHDLARSIARENRGEIESEPVYVHLADPMAEAIEDHAADYGMIGIKGIPRAAVIRVARAVRLKNVVGGVVQSAEAQRRSAVAPFPQYG